MTELAHVLRHVPTESTDPNVLVGLDTPDDSAVYRVSDDQAIVQSVDFFTPIVDDAYDWGRIAAANALSDIYAMGGKPVIALNLVGWPRSLDMELLGRVLEGAGAVCREAGVTIVGGHSVDDPEPKYGLAVTGMLHPDQVLRKAGVTVGSELVLTKALGTGIIATALKQGTARQEWVDEAVDSMTTLNQAAAEAMVEVGVEAATDVTGFGLVGHLLQMLDGIAGAEIDFSNVPVLSGAIELAGQGVFPGGSVRNFDATKDKVDTGSLDESEYRVLFDAQTSGGLLMAVSAVNADTLIEALTNRGVAIAARIGLVVDEPGRIKVSTGG